MLNSFAPVDLRVVVRLRSAKMLFLGFGIVVTKGTVLGSLI